MEVTPWPKAFLRYYSGFSRKCTVCEPTLLYFGPVDSTVQNCVQMFAGHIPLDFTGGTKTTAHTCIFYWFQTSKQMYTVLACRNYRALLLLLPVDFTVAETVKSTVI